MAVSEGLGPALTNSPNEQSRGPARRPSGSVTSAWTDWLAKPENKAAMIQAGVSLLQPPSAGQSGVGQIGQAIGEGAAARDRAITGRQAQAQQQQDAAIAQQNADTARISAESGRTQAGAQAEYYRANTATARDKASSQLSALSKALDAVNQQILGDGETPELLSMRSDIVASIAALSKQLGGAAAAPSRDIQTVSTPEEAMQLPPGTVFRTPDGRVKVR